MSEELKKLAESPLQLALIGAGLLVWMVWLRRRSEKGPAELTQLPAWDVMWLEVIFFCFTALWAQVVVTMIFSGLIRLANPGLAESAGFAGSPEFAAAASLASPLGFLLAWWAHPRMFPRRPPPPPTEHRPLGWGAALAASVPLYLAWIPVLIFSMLLSQALMPESAPQDTLKVFTEAGPLHQALIFLGAAIGAPVAEELVFRGRLYPMLKSRLGMTNAAALGALVFSLIHAYPAGLLSLFLFGLMLTYAYERHGSVKVPILLHFMNNGVSLAVALLAPLPPPAPPADTAAPPPAVAPESPR